MADDPLKRGPQDRSRISTSKDHEVRCWSQKFGVSPEQLKAAVRKVGNSAKAAVAPCGDLARLASSWLEMTFSRGRRHPWPFIDRLPGGETRPRSDLACVIKGDRGRVGRSSPRWNRTRKNMTRVPLDIPWAKKWPAMRCYGSVAIRTRRLLPCGTCREGGRPAKTSAAASAYAYLVLGVGGVGGRALVLGRGEAWAAA